MCALREKHLRTTNSASILRKYVLPQSTGKLHHILIFKCRGIRKLHILASISIGALV